MIVSAPSSSMAAIDSDRRLQHVRRAALDGAIVLDLDRPVVGMVGRGQREVDVADRGAALGHAVLHHQMVHLHVVRFGDVDDGELVAEQPWRCAS